MPSRRLGGGLPQLGLVKRHEIDRLDHQGRHAAVAHHIGDDAAGEGKQHVRRLDQKDRLHRLFGDILKPEQAGIGQFEQEKLAVFALGMDAQLQFDLEMLIVAAPRLDVDAEFDLGPLGQPRGRAGVLE